MFHDLRYAVRILLKSPAFTAVAVLTLALGIGANTAIFSVVYSVLLRQLPFDEPGRLVMLWERNPDVGLDQEQVAPATFVDWQKQNRVFEQVGFLLNSGSGSRNFVLVTEAEPVRIRGRFASSSLFDVLRVRPILGRAFQAEDDQRGGQQSALLSYSLWKRSFGGDASAIGKPLNVGGSYTIVGVMPPNFRFPPDAEVWLSWSGWDYLNRMNRYDFHGLWAFGRLKHDVSLEQAQAEMNVLQERIAEQHPEIVQVGSQVVVVPLLDQVIGQRTRTALLVLLAAVAFVLLIACANVANLLLARAAGRQKEIAIRSALGAGRMRVLRQLLTESVLLAILGGGLGILLALWGIHVLGAMAVDHTYRGVTEFRMDRLNDVSLNVSVLGFTLLVSVTTGIIFGLFPAVQTSRGDVGESLKEEGRSTAGSARQRARGFLLISEVALALVLLIGAGLMIQSLLHMRQIDPGFDPQNAMLFELDMELASRTFSGDRQEIAFQVMERIRSVPGVVSVGAASEIPLRKSGWTETVAVEGRPAVPAGDLPTADVRIVTPDLFRALGVALSRGRDFSEHDADGATSVALVNETMARQFFPNEEPIGKRFRYRGSFPPVEIVGIIGDMRRFGLEFTVRPEVYQPYRQQVWGGSELGPVVVVRTASDPVELLGAIHHEIEGPNPKQRIIGRVQTLDDILAASIADQRLRTALLGLFAAVALVLATVGIYGVVSYAVTQRTHEIGIRMALGAQPGDVLRLVIGHGLKLTAIGVVVGLAVAVAGTRTLSSMLYGISGTDLATYVSVSALLTTVALMACYIPARRATKVDPMVALRYE